MSATDRTVPGEGWAATIAELHAVFESLDSGEVESVEVEGYAITSTDEVRDRLDELPLSVTIRHGWVVPGEDPRNADTEYSILLGTGGPAVRVYGTLDRYGYPADAELQGQDWFTPWMSTRVTEEEQAAIVWFAQSFYFGE